MNAMGNIYLSDEFRKLLGLAADDEMDITLHNGEMIIKKSIPGCIFCNSTLNLIKMGEYSVCNQCVAKLSSSRIGDTLYPTNVE